MKSCSKIFMSFALMSLALATGCSGGGGSAAGQTDSPSTSTNVVPTDFYVSVANSDKLTNHMRTVGSFATNCSITPSSSSNQDLTCIVDAPEGDVNFHGIELTYNVPPGACTYLSRYTYWYYNEEIGYGPKAVGIKKTVNDDGKVLTMSCSENGNPVYGPCSGMVEYTTDSSDGSYTCVYDRTGMDLHNCCLGDYTYTLETTVQSSGAVTTTNEQKSWGGDIKNCIGGPGKTNWKWYSKSGYPTGVIVPATNGITETYKVKGPKFTVNDGLNMPVANFYTPALHTHDGYVLNRVSTLPYFVDPIDDRDGDEIPTANIGYTFMCEDQAYEIKNRITVYVREWDLYSDYLTYIATAGVTAVPDRPGKYEPGDCDGLDGACNDDWDLDDFINEYLQHPYETATKNLRGLNFPFEDFDSTPTP